MAQKDTPSKPVSAKLMGANESNTNLHKLAKMGANPTLVGKGQGVRKS